MPTLYVLRSLKDNRTYVGSSDNFDRRFKQHNSCRVKSTKHRIPFEVLFTEEFETIQEAKKRELYYKSGAGRRKLKEFFNKISRTKPNTGNGTINFKISPTHTVKIGLVVA